MTQDDDGQDDFTVSSGDEPSTANVPYQPPAPPPEPVIEQGSDSGSSSGGEEQPELPEGQTPGGPLEEPEPVEEEQPAE